ncbi:Mut7-C RNAse domain-containing protein [Calditrichota bacterium]
MKLKKAFFRFYEELNDFLPADQRKVSFKYSFSGNPTIKDAIEAIGIPHPEVDLIVVNSNSVDFNYHLMDGDQVSVYPVFESIDISPIIKLRAKPLRHTKFILDVQLGKLSRWLRLLGFDSQYRNDYQDIEIVKTALAKLRIILTRDQELLKIKVVNHGYWVRSTDVEKQLVEIINRFDLRSQLNPFTRCMVCNGILEKVEKRQVINSLLPQTKKYNNEFYQCSICLKVYWKGSHYKKMKNKIEQITKIRDDQYKK